MAMKSATTAVLAATLGLLFHRLGSTMAAAVARAIWHGAQVLGSPLAEADHSMVSDRLEDCTNVVAADRASSYSIT
jgi:hypothetical protein